MAKEVYYTCDFNANLGKHQADVQVSVSVVDSDKAQIFDVCANHTASTVTTALNNEKVKTVTVVKLGTEFKAKGKATGKGTAKKLPEPVECCGKMFDTAIGLATHKSRIHGERKAS